MIKADKNVVADSTFYICYSSDINKIDFLNTLVKSYSFHIGPHVLKELPHNLVSCDLFISSLDINEISFFEIVKPYFGRTNIHEDDGEYEAIGIAYHLDTFSDLNHLIIDDKIAYNFVQNNFPSLKSKLIRNIGFIVNCCKTDAVVPLDYIIELLETIKQCVEKSYSSGSKKRPCSIDIKLCKTYLVSLIKQLKDEYECS